MFSIFNGKERGLGGKKNRVFLKVSVEMREYMSLFKGAKLSVLMTIALHADEEGYAFPSISKLCKETGYNEETVIKALGELCDMRINNHRVLLRIKKQDDATKRFMSNRYLLFPSEEEAQALAGTDTEKPCTENPGTANPCTENTGYKENQRCLKKNQSEEEPLQENSTNKIIYASPALAEQEAKEQSRNKREGDRTAYTRHNEAPSHTKPETVTTMLPTQTNTPPRPKKEDRQNYTQEPDLFDDRPQLSPGGGKQRFANQNTQNGQTTQNPPALAKDSLFANAVSKAKNEPDPERNPAGYYLRQFRLKFGIQPEIGSWAGCQKTLQDLIKRHSKEEFVVRLERFFNDTKQRSRGYSWQNFKGCWNTYQFDASQPPTGRTGKPSYREQVEEGSTVIHQLGDLGFWQE